MGYPYWLEQKSALWSQGLLEVSFRRGGFPGHGCTLLGSCFSSEYANCSEMPLDVI